MALIESENEIKKILEELNRIAVVGLSPVPARPSYGVTKYMIKHGYEIYGVRPASPPEILGRPCVEKLDQLKADVDIIDVFRNSDAIQQVVDEVEAWFKKLPAEHRPKVLWLQLGIRNPEAEARAEKLGLKVIADKCILQEHARLL